MDQQVTTDYARDFAKARQLLKRGDINGYWAVMVGHDKYAETARNVAANRNFWGYHANQHLQREAERVLGRPLNQDELSSIMYDIADGDLEARQASVLGGRGIGLTSGEIERYHVAALDKKRLPPSAYLGEQWQDLIGPAWSAAAGTPGLQRPGIGQGPTFATSWNSIRTCSPISKSLSSPSARISASTRRWPRTRRIISTGCSTNTSPVSTSATRRAA